MQNPQRPPLSFDQLPDPDEILGPLPDGPETSSPRRRGAAAASKPRRGARSSTSSSGAESGGKAARLRQIGDDLTNTFVLLGTAATPFAPVTGAVLVARGPQGADIVCNLAAKDERVYRALLAVSKYAVYGELAMFVGTIALAVTVDMGVQDPESFVVQRLIGEDILSTVHAARSSGASANGRQQSAAAVPSGWQPQTYNP